MGHVTRMDESFHKSMSPVAIEWIMSLVQESCRTYEQVCCFVLLNRYLGIVMVTGFLLERAKGARTDD